MVARIQSELPNLVAAYQRGRQLKEGREDRAMQRGFLQEQQQRQRQRWGQEDEERSLLQKGLQEKKELAYTEDVQKALSFLDPEDPNFAEESQMAKNWIQSRHPDMADDLNSIPAEELAPFVRQAQFQMGIGKEPAAEKQFTLGPGQQRFTAEGKTIAAVEPKESPEQWQPWGYGQMRNKATGEIKDVQVAPRKNEIIRQLPGGGIEIIRGDIDGKKKPLKFTEQQAKTGGFATRIEAANKIMGDLEDSLSFEPTSIKGKIAESVPYIGNLLSDENRQVYNQAKADFITAALRLESGAAISDAEFARDDKKYFPQPGDGPKVIANKRALRDRQFKIMSRSSGGAYDAISDVEKKASKQIPIENYPSASVEDLENIFRGQ